MKTPKWCFFMSDNAALKAKQEAGFVHVSDSGKTKGGKAKKYGKSEKLSLIKNFWIKFYLVC